MMATIILGIVDTHWSEKRPRSRKDDFKKTQERKIQDLFRLASGISIAGATGASAILHGGDMYHQPEGKLISRRLDTWLSSLLRNSPVPILTIPGNHDMKAHRMESLDNHPYGVLLANQVIKQVTWPGYQVVGTDPPVIVTGREFREEGPSAWLDWLSSSGELNNFKGGLKSSTGANVQCAAATHSWWGPVDTINRGQPVCSYNHLKGTGIDIMLYGHPHTCDGVMRVQDDSGQLSVVGPGAFVRGTVAEHDINREPKVAILVFNSDGTRDVKLVSIPHESAEIVFDLERHNRVKREAEVEEKFVEECKKLGQTSKSLKEVLSAVDGKGFPPNVFTLVRQYLTRAEGDVK